MNISLRYLTLELIKMKVCLKNLRRCCSEHVCQLGTPDKFCKNIFTPLKNNIAPATDYKIWIYILKNKNLCNTRLSLCHLSQVFFRTFEFLNFYKDYRINTVLMEDFIFFLRFVIHSNFLLSVTSLKHYYHPFGIRFTP